jgi:hypothetical protein
MPGNPFHGNLPETTGTDDPEARWFFGLFL